MTTEEKLNEAVRVGREVQTIYEEMRKRVIPKTVKEALVTGWEIEIEGFELDLPDSLFYSEGDRSKDAARICPLKSSVAAIGEMEEALCQSLIRSPFKIWAKKWNRYRQMISFLGEHAGDIAEGIEAAAKVLWSDLAKVNWGQDWSGILEAVSVAVGTAMAAVIAACAAGALGLALQLVTTGTDAVGPAMWAAMLAEITTAKEAAQKKIRGRAFPQRSVPRYWRRKETRR